MNEQNSYVKERLLSLVEPKFQRFSSSLMPGVKNVLGVRRPQLRALAKEIAAGDWRAYLDGASSDSFEEILIQGLVIGYAKHTGIEEFLLYIAKYVPKIDNWATCDNFCSTLKYTKKCRGEMWDFLQPYLKDRREYYLRFGAVMLLTYYADDEYMDRTLAALTSIRHEAYYVKMGVAWAMSVCFVHCPEKTMACLKNCAMDDFTFNKSLQKIVESYRVDNPTKEIIKKINRKVSQ